MEFVVNDVVKMEWDKSTWIQKKNGKFVLAGKVYSTPNGDVTVFFQSSDAYIFATEEGAWDTDTLRRWLNAEKKNNNGRFPYVEEYDEYICLVDENGKVYEDIAAEWGLSDYIDDIEARYQDILPYGYETII